MSDQPAATQPVFNIEKIYVKDLSLENPNSPQVFLQQHQPQVEVQLQTRAAGVAEGYYEAVLTLTVTAKSGEQVVFLVEASQAGIFQIRNLPEQDLPGILGIHCPNILFPYARETVADAVGRAGFPPVHLAPVNFEALYQQQQAAQQQGAPAVAAPVSPGPTH
jgi:preprotein translocase subunit SecB